MEGQGVPNQETMKERPIAEGVAEPMPARGVLARHPSQPIASASSNSDNDSMEYESPSNPEPSPTRQRRDFQLG